MGKENYVWGCVIRTVHRGFSFVFGIQSSRFYLNFWPDTIHKIPMFPICRALLCNRNSQFIRIFLKLSKCLTVESNCTFPDILHWEWIIFIFSYDKYFTFSKVVQYSRLCDVCERESYIVSKWWVWYFQIISGIYAYRRMRWGVESKWKQTQVLMKFLNESKHKFN